MSHERSLKRATFFVVYVGLLPEVGELRSPA
jgi:hypothetical protein